MAKLTHIGFSEHGNGCDFHISADVKDFAEYLVLRDRIRALFNEFIPRPSPKDAEPTAAEPAPSPAVGEYVYVSPEVNAAVPPVASTAALAPTIPAPPVVVEAPAPAAAEPVAPPVESAPTPEESPASAAEPVEEAAEEEDDPERPFYTVFDLACDRIKTVADAVKVWYEHVGYIKTLPDSSKLRCSNTLSMRTAAVLSIEISEAHELIKNAIRKEQDARKAAAASKTVPPAAPSEAVQKFKALMSAEPKPILGIAVKHACTALAVNNEVSTQAVEDFLFSMIGECPAVESKEAVEKITKTNRMKLYAGAAKVKLT